MRAHVHGLLHRRLIAMRMLGRIGPPTGGPILLRI